jgi:hypothetical protein
MAPPKPAPPALTHRRSTDPEHVAYPNRVDHLARYLKWYAAGVAVIGLGSCASTAFLAIGGLFTLPGARSAANERSIVEIRANERVQAESLAVMHHRMMESIRSANALGCLNARAANTPLTGTLQRMCDTVVANYVTRR